MTAASISHAGTAGMASLASLLQNTALQQDVLQRFAEVVAPDSDEEDNTSVVATTLY